MVATGLWSDVRVRRPHARRPRGAEARQYIEIEGEPERGCQRGIADTTIEPRPVLLIKIESELCNNVPAMRTVSRGDDARHFRGKGGKQL